MRPADFKRAVNKAPFRPFRLVLRSGFPLTVREPEHYAVSPSGAFFTHADDRGSVRFRAEQVTEVVYLDGGE